MVRGYTAVSHWLKCSLSTHHCAFLHTHFKWNLSESKLIEKTALQRRQLPQHKQILNSPMRTTEENVDISLIRALFCSFKKWQCAFKPWLPNSTCSHNALLDARHRFSNTTPSLQVSALSPLGSFLHTQSLPLNHPGQQVVTSLKIC